MPTTYDGRTDRRAFRHSSMRRRFTPVRPASPFHAGPTCVAVFTPVRPAPPFHSGSTGVAVSRRPDHSADQIAAREAGHQVV
jgi:hypothetical protein